jgi:hypothetical protein
MNKLIFERCNIEEMNTVREPVRIVFELESNLEIGEFKRCCKRLAQAMGYSDVNITREFGVDGERGNPAQLKLLLG